MTRATRARRQTSTPSLARFFTKQMLMFVALALLIVMVDFFLYTLIAYRESNEHYNDDSPATAMRAVDAALSRGEDGAWTLSEDGERALDERDAWALLVDESGAVAWSQRVPDEVPRSFSPNDVAMAAHYAEIADYPAFFWDRDDGLLVMGFPKGEYWHESLTYPASTIANLPLYVLLVFAVDLGILFVLYAVARRRTQSAVGPIVDALDALSEGRAAELNLKGDLREIGQRITETSGIIEQKDAARANWIRGVSHDIRTPLSMILGYADAIAADEGASDDVRADAQVIRAQGLKIKDLVTDLNTASKLDYDMQPLDLERVHLPRLLRSVVAEHVNSGLDELHPLELDLDENALDGRRAGRRAPDRPRGRERHRERAPAQRAGLPGAGDAGRAGRTRARARGRRRRGHVCGRVGRAQGAARPCAHRAQRGGVVRRGTRSGACARGPHRPGPRRLDLHRKRTGRGFSVELSLPLA